MQLPEVLLFMCVTWCRWLSSYGWQQEAWLDEAGNIMLYWTADVKKNVLMVEIQGRTQGYVALGISRTKTMAGADLLIGYLDQEGEPHVLDYWSDKNGPPILDKSQDWKLLAGRENGTHTMIRVRRPIRPNIVNDINVYDFPTWILWAWHPHDPGKDQAPEYHHKNRGATRLCLLTSDCWPKSPRPIAGGAGGGHPSLALIPLLALLPRLF
ncbi:DBH-like monooxygenase protein 1 [Penaeus vannamei]|uniref:DBH-like monooxygenase protein 1 n=1 Tax=Penaeus vannamei TaxID=6689 RepID=UPI00387F6C0E